MTLPFSTHAFIAGELDRAFYGRTDLEKYDLGVALARNFYIDFRGGLRSRPGTQLIAPLPLGSRIFTFSTSCSHCDIILVFRTNGTLWLYQQGARVEASPGVPLELSTPYSAADLAQLQMNIRDQRATFVTGRNPVYVLSVSSGTWTFAPDGVSALPAPNAPSGLSYDHVGNSHSGSARTVVMVTAVTADGIEGPASLPTMVTNLLNYAVTEGTGRFTVAPVAGASAYRFYRSSIVINDTLTLGQDVGFIGESRATSFIDANIVPDYTIQPPRFYNPFSPGAIIRLNVTNGGSGYANSTTVSVAGGTGFRGYPLIDAGVIVGIVVLNGGTGFTTASAVTLDSTGGGSGAAISVAEVSPATGLFPYAQTFFQQRQFFAGLDASPLAVFGSRPGQGNEFNFDVSPVPNAGDGIVEVVDIQSSSPIRHLLSIRDGLLLFHSFGVERLSAAEGRAVTAINRVFENQTHLGCGTAAPALVNDDVIYASPRGSTVVSLNFTYYTNSYQAQELSILAPHLLADSFNRREHTPVRLVWHAEPHKILWVLRKDGRLLSLTYLREQEIYGWAQHETQGRILDITLVREQEQDTLHLLVERFGTIYLERLMPRDVISADRYWGVDCGLRYEGATRSTALQIALTRPAEGQTPLLGELITITAPSDDFTGTEGHILRAAGGVWEIETVVSATQAQARLLSYPSEWRADDQTPEVFTWTLTEPVTTVSGLSHLNGRTVAILADGNALPQVVVSGGSVTFDRPYSLITIGLPFECEALTLPLTIPQQQTDGRRKRIVGTAVRTLETRGLEIGTRILYEIRERLPNNWGEVRPLEDGNLLVFVKARWERDAQLRMRQRYPLPATILGLVTEAEIQQ